MELIIMRILIRFGTLIIVLCVFVASKLQAQVDFSSYISRISAAELLAGHKIDTTNIALIRQIADSNKHWMKDYALLFLAQHGDRSILPLAQSRFHEGIQKNLCDDSYYPLGAIEALEGRNAYPYAVALLDSMLIQNQEHRGKYKYFATDIAGVIEVLLDFGDVSRYELFKSLFTGQNRPYSTDIENFCWFAQLDPSKESDAYETVKSFLDDSDVEYRVSAVRTIYWFKNQSSRFDLLKQSALNNSSVQVRYWAADYLLSDGLVGDAINAFEQLVKSGLDTSYCSYAEGDLERINSPYAYAALIRLKNELQTGSLLDDVNLGLKVYKPWRLYKTLAIFSTIDTLGAFTKQCASLGWLGDANFIKELTNHLADAKKHLAKGDSVNCGKEVAKFQDKVQKEYKKKTKSKDKRFVKDEGYKFLYYNAQYIIDRLPGKK
jgi:hypothetical protein